MNRLFQVAVITWALFYIGWALFSHEMAFLEWIALALVVTGFWMAAGMLLMRRLPLVRFLLLLAVVGRLLLLSREADLSMFDYFDYSSVARDPSTGWAINVSLLLDGFVLAMAYLTPVADGFETPRPSPRTRTGAFFATIFRSDGAMITSMLLVALTLFVVNEFVIGARYAENSPHAIVARASESIEAGEASGDKRKLGLAYLEAGNAYWVLGQNEKAALMYERFLALDAKGSYWSSHVPVVFINRLLKIYSTEPDARFGDGTRALAMAARLPENLRNTAYYDAVAAVYARLGQMDKAIQNQEVAVERCTANGYCCEENWEYAYHLEQYKQEPNQ